MVPFISLKSNKIINKKGGVFAHNMRKMARFSTNVKTQKMTNIFTNNHN